jgi:hypothetical protein
MSTDSSPRVASILARSVCGFCFVHFDPIAFLLHFVLVLRFFLFYLVHFRCFAFFLYSVAYMINNNDNLLLLSIFLPSQQLVASQNGRVALARHLFKLLRRLGD